MRTERRPTSVPPPREAPEQVVVRVRRSGRHLVLPAAFFLVLCAGSAYAAARHLPSPWMDAAVPIAAAGLVVLLSLLPLLFWLNRVTILTTRRIIVRRGFLVRERTELSLARASDAVLRRGPLQLLWRSGDVVVHAGADGTVTLRDLPRARLVHRAVVELIERAGA